MESINLTNTNSESIFSLFSLIRVFATINMLDDKGYNQYGGHLALSQLLDATIKLGKTTC